MAGGALLFAGGTVLDATGVGAIVGVPGNAAGAALFSAGLAVTTVGGIETQAEGSLQAHGH